MTICGNYYRFLFLPNIVPNFLRTGNKICILLTRFYITALFFLFHFLLIIVQRFAAVIMRIREPKTTALIFASGKMVILFLFQMSIFTFKLPVFECGWILFITYDMFLPVFIRFALEQKVSNNLNWQQGRFGLLLLTLVLIWVNQRFLRQQTIVHQVFVQLEIK